MFDSDINNLVRLTKDQVKPAANILTRAFQDYPFWVCIFPAPSKREQKHLPFMFEFLINYCIQYGEVYTTPNAEGVALWLPPDKTLMTITNMIRAGGWKFLFKFKMKNLSKLRTYNNFTEAAHIRSITSRHWYLIAIGVNSIHHGKGYSSNLLKPMLARIDKERLPIYLETHDKKNIPLYEHFGFKVIEKAKIPGSDITNWAMLRTPLTKIT
ncbi:MAG: GNAT family N-acetyltransferase [Candidatus Ranarchaeia archaeon]